MVHKALAAHTVQLSNCLLPEAWSDWTGSPKAALCRNGNCMLPDVIRIGRYDMDHNSNGQCDHNMQLHSVLSWLSFLGSNVVRLQLEAQTMYGMVMIITFKVS